MSAVLRRQREGEQHDQSVTTLVERRCELTEELAQFKPLYWWLEYWGDWARRNGPGKMSLLERLLRYGDEFIPPTDDGDGFPDTIRLLERALAALRNTDRFQYRVVASVHIGKYSFAEIAGTFNIRKRGVRRTLMRAYGTVQTELLWQDRRFLEVPAPVYAPP